MDSERGAWRGFDQDYVRPSNPAGGTFGGGVADGNEINDGPRGSTPQ